LIVSDYDNDYDNDNDNDKTTMVLVV